MSWTRLRKLEMPAGRLAGLTTLTLGAMMVQFCTILRRLGSPVMPRQSISFTEPNAEWLRQKVDTQGEYRSNSEAVNDLIRKARELELIRARLIEAERSGFTPLSRDQIRAEIREEMQRNGELQDHRRRKSGS